MMNGAKFARYYHKILIVRMNRFFTALFAGLIVPVSLTFAAETKIPEKVMAQLRGMAAAKAAETQGESMDLSRSCISYVNVGGFSAHQDNIGSVACLVKSDDGSCSLVYPVSEMTTEPITGTISDDKVTFTLPQVVRTVTIEEEGKDVTYNIVVAAFSEQKVDDEYVTWLADKNQTVIFNLEADGSLKAADTSLMIGVGIDMGEDGLQWTGFGDVDIAMKPMTARPVELPADISVENYVVRSFDSPFIARVGFDGDDVYMQGLISSLPDGWIKGKLADGKVTFANGQYLGIAQTFNTFRNYAYCVVTTKDYDSDFNEVYAPVEPEFEVTYDADDKSFSFASNQVVCMNIDPEELSFRSSMEFVSLEYRGMFEPTTPPDPQIDYFDAYDPDSGYGEIDFTMPDEGADGKVLDFNSYYYNLIVDGEVYEVTPAVYPAVTEAMTDIPYTFSDNNDIYAYSEGYHILYFRIPEYRTIALQSVYTIDGVTNRSAVVLAGESALTDKVADLSPVVSEEYFDLSGRAVSSRSTGLLIRRVTRADGSVETSKTVVR